MKDDDEDGSRCARPAGGQAHPEAVIPALAEEAHRLDGMSRGPDAEHAHWKIQARAACAVVLACILLACCALFVPDIDDLRLVGVRSVEAGALDLHGGYWQNWWPKQPANYLVGKIIVVTKIDLHDFVWRHEFTSGRS